MGYCIAIGIVILQQTLHVVLPKLAEQEPELFRCGKLSPVFKFVLEELVGHGLLLHSGNQRLAVEDECTHDIVPKSDPFLELQHTSVVDVQIVGALSYVRKLLNFKTGA